MTTGTVTRRLLATGSVLLVAAFALAWQPVASYAEDTPGNADPGRMVLVLDSSGSMKERTGAGETKIAAAREALTAVIGSLPDEQAVGLRVYGAEVFSRDDPGACTDSRLVVPVETGNRDRLREAVGRYTPYGETPIGHALQEAGRDLGSEGKRTIVLVSDGEPTCTPDPCVVARDLAQQGVDLTIDVVGLDVDGRARDALSCIADAGNGDYYDVDSADELTASLEKLATRAGRPYATIGEPVTGTPTSQGAPEIGAGDWLDELGPEDSETSVRTYLVRRTAPGSTLHVGASVKSARDAGDDWLQVDLSRTDGSSCSSAGEINQLAEGQLTTAGCGGRPDRHVRRRPHQPRVQHRRDPDRHGDPRERRGRYAAGGAGAGAAPGRDPASLPERYDGEPPWPAPPSGTASPVTGGSSFQDAPLLEPGVYEDSIVPGEVLTYQVEADWGQQVSALVDYPKVTGTKLGDAVGMVDMLTQVRIYDPARADASQLSAGGPNSQNWLYDTGEDVGAATLPVAFRNSDRFADQAGTYTSVSSSRRTPTGSRTWCRSPAPRGHRRAVGRAGVPRRGGRPPRGGLRERGAVRVGGRLAAGACRRGAGHHRDLRGRCVLRVLRGAGTADGARGPRRARGRRRRLPAAAEPGRSGPVALRQNVRVRARGHRRRRPLRVRQVPPLPTARAERAEPRRLLQGRVRPDAPPTSPWGSSTGTTRTPGCTTTRWPRSRTLCHRGEADVPIYDISRDGRVGHHRLSLDGAPYFVAEGIFAQEIVRECVARGLLAEAICVSNHRLVTFWRRLTRDLREHRKPPWVLLRRGLMLLRAEPRVIAHAVELGCTPMAVERAYDRIHELVAGPVPLHG